jgi:hypothetical protein
MGRSAIEEDVKLLGKFWKKFFWPLKIVEGFIVVEIKQFTD